MGPDIDVKSYEDVINEILPGLTMYVRDVNLSPVCADKYEPQTIIMERGFTDASSRVMGMVTTHRYAILSNHMADFGQYEHETNWELLSQSAMHILRSLTCMNIWERHRFYCFICRMIAGGKCLKM